MSLRWSFVPVVLVTALRAQTPTTEVQAKIAPIFEQARTAERQGRPQEALECYEKVLRLAPGIAEVWANKGLLLYNLNRHPEALRAFLEASRLKPGLVTPSLYAGIEYLQLGQPRKALAPLRTALRIEPQNGEARSALARAHLQLEEYGEAVDELKRQPASAEVWRQLGAAYLAWSTSATQALAANGSAYGLLLRAEFAAVNGKPDVALLRYKTAMGRLDTHAAAEIPLDPQTVRLPAGRREQQPAQAEPASGSIASAVAAWRQAQYSRSLQILRTVIRNVPRDSRALYWLALACRALARESFLRAMESSPDSWEAHLLAADAAARDGDQELALVEYRKAVALAPNEPRPRLAEIEHLVSIQRMAEATGRAQEAVALFPHDTELNYLYGKLLLESEKAKEALPYLKQAAAHTDLANAYAALGDFENAIAAMKPALAKDEDGSLHYKIAGWYRETGQMEEARKALAETARRKKIR